MAEIFEMPQASPTMEAGTILAWHKEEGAVLAPQDVIAEVETDKAAMEIEVFDVGVLLKILVPAGDEVPAGAPIAIIGRSADEDITELLAKAEQALSALQSGATAAASAAAAPAAPAAAAPAAAAPAAAAPAAAAPSPAAPSSHAIVGMPPLTWQGKPLASGIMEPVAVFGGPSSAQGDDRVRSSPASRRAARERGLDIATVPGTGPRGRVTVADIEAQRAAAAPPTGLVPTGLPAADSQVRNSQMRKTIARRLKAAYLDAPSFFLTARFDCDRLVAFRAQLKAAEVRVSYNDIVVKAAARALVDVPEVNASWGEQAITRHGEVHVGVAVALPDGLITPVVRNTDTKGLATIGAEIRELASRARDRKLQPHEYQGSTFTISNLGMMEIEHFTAILNSPEAAILAVGGLQQEPVVRDGQLTTAWQMRVTLTCDHRVVDGALGARFLQALRRYLENPALLAS